MPNFWIRRIALAAGILCLLFIANESLGLDVRLADSVFYDWRAHRWIGAGTWWAVDMIHTAGRLLVQLVALAALLTVVASYCSSAARPMRRDALYVFLCIVLATGIVGLLKQLTNVDCPWDLAHYGGTRPYFSLFANRPNDLPRAACFPGAHSSSGFSLICFYYVLRDRRPNAARWALAGALLVGTLFAFGQQARGAHFLSHDITSAVLVWLVCSLLHASFYSSTHRGPVEIPQNLI